MVSNWLRIKAFLCTWCAVFLWGWCLVLFSCSAEHSSVSKRHALFSVGTDTIKTFSTDRVVLSTLENKTYNRIVLLATPFYNYFQALNAETNVVGVLNHDRLTHVGSHVQSVGQGDQIDLERIMALDPDLIICNSYQLDQVKSFDQVKLVCDEYLESDPLRRLDFLSLIAPLVGANEKAENVINDKLKCFKTYKVNAEKMVLKLDNFGSGWYEPGCDTYVSNVIRFAGAKPVCVNGSEKSEKISDEQAILALGSQNFLLFMDWGLSKEGYQKRMAHILTLDNYPARMIYCNTTQSDYFQQSVLNSHLIINDLHEVLFNGAKGRFFEIVSLEE